MHAPKLTGDGGGGAGSLGVHDGSIDNVVFGCEDVRIALDKHWLRVSGFGRLSCRGSRDVGGTMMKMAMAVLGQDVEQAANG